MIAASFLLLAALSPARADPGRAFAGLTLGATGPGARAATSLRGHLDYGLTRRLALRAEAGRVGPAAWGGAAGLRLDAVDGPWWRVGVTALPEVVLAAGDAPPPGWRLGAAPAGLVGRAGLRADWLLFWGLCLSGRLDRVQAGAGGTAGWWDAGLGLSVRM